LGFDSRIIKRKKKKEERKKKEEEEEEVEERRRRRRSLGVVSRVMENHQNWVAAVSKIGRPFSKLNLNPQSTKPRTAP